MTHINHRYPSWSGDFSLPAIAFMCSQRLTFHFSLLTFHSLPARSSFPFCPFAPDPHWIPDRSQMDWGRRDRRLFLFVSS